MKRSNIGWTGLVWNLTTGCSRVNEECRDCYAFALHDMRHRAYLAGKQVAAQYALPFSEVQLLPHRLDDPLRWRKGQFVFVDSMGDLFHAAVPLGYIDRGYDTMRRASQHTFQVLTKRPSRRRAWARGKQPLPNVWEGVSCGQQSTVEAFVPLLQQTPAALRFLSIEPMLSAVTLRSELLRGIGWAIFGCESHGKRVGRLSVHGHCDEAEWHRRAGDAVDQCHQAGLAVFVKQVPIDGRVITDISQFPPRLQYQDYPAKEGTP